MDLRPSPPCFGYGAMAVAQGSSITGPLDYSPFFHPIADLALLSASAFINLHTFFCYLLLLNKCFELMAAARYSIKKRLLPYQIQLPPRFLY